MMRTPEATGWPLFRIREGIMIQLVRCTYPLYIKWFKQGRPAWQKSSAELMAYPDGTLGKTLELFLQRNEIHLIPKLENHDVFHVLLNYDTHAVAESQMQFCLIGNGKRSLYAIGTAVVASLAFPEYWGSFRRAYRRGKALRRFYRWYFEYLLDEPIEEMKAFIANKPSAYYTSVF